MKPFRILLPALTALALVLAACHNRKQEAATTAAPAPTVRIVPGQAPQASELAMMMRAMTAFADSTRLRIAQGRELPPFPDQFRKLMTAEATPGMKDPKAFDPFAHAWLYHLDALYKAPETERTGVFNTLVQTCAGCHTTMCPGPLVKIKKLGLPAKAD